MSTYYTSKYSGEQIDEALKKIMDGEMTGDYADRQLSNLDTPQGALANLGAGVRPNLLINPFFEVNQRGRTSYSGSAAYFIDMWKLNNSAMSAQISDEYINVISTSMFQSIVQRIENYKELFGKTLTLSAIIKGALGNTVGIGIGNENPSSGVYFRERFACTGDWQLVTMTFSLPEISPGDTYLEVLCYPEFTSGGTGGTSDWMAAKLEEGDTQTLAYQDEDGAWQLLPQPESDYAMQLAKCQRYQLFFQGGTVRYRNTQATGNIFDFTIPIPVTMRTIPAIEQGNVSINRILENGIISGSAETGFSFSLAGMDNNALCIRATKNNHGLNNALLSFNNVLISANL